MPDAKITALTAISVIDPAVDPLPIVDVSDTAMAASGTTKKITINQILGASGAATLASATITGDLTVDTNTLKVVSSLDFVAIGATAQSFGEKFRINGNYTLMNDGAFTGFLGKASAIGASGSTTDFGIRSENALIFLSGGATERMRIDSSGNVGIGVTPSVLSNVTRLEIGGALSCNLTLRSTSANASARNWMVAANAVSFGDFVIRQGNSQGAEPNSGTDRLYIDPSGNLILQSSATPATLTTNGQLTVNATSNTNLRFSYRGSDGVTRVANITLA